jgi:uncharacterized membrane protein HdeD (DUF308 family)
MRCGLLLLGSSLVALVPPLAAPAWARPVAGCAILAGGAAEIAAGLAGFERGATDLVLGLLSLAAGLILLAARQGDALWLTALLSAWLLARGATELLGGLGESRAIAAVATARLLRGAADLILGLLALIGALASAFAEILVGWPATIVNLILLFVAASLMGSAGLHIWLAFAVRRARRR